MSRALHLFYRDLRLRDNPALCEACRCDELLLLYILPNSKKPWDLGAASKSWLSHSLRALQHSIEKKGGKLVLEMGDWLSLVLKVVQDKKITDLFFNLPFEGHLIPHLELQKACEVLGVNVHFFKSALLFDPETLLTQSNKPYQVFTPFSKACLKLKKPRAPLPMPKKFPQGVPARGVALSTLRLTPQIHWDRHFYEVFTPGEEGALKRLDQFTRQRLKAYSQDRDYPAIEGTSRLSPHLHFGEISIHTVWEKAYGTFQTQLLWREFAYHLLYHFPKTSSESLNGKFFDFPWRKNPAKLKAWQQGKTGFPIVDAGMRQLWQTGWMHNRVRMIVGSFLVKDLLIPWQEGAKWFWDTLVDADLANNTLGWQWVAGCGADAAPFFRIFNPTLQGQKFDKEGDYIRRYVPELKNLPEAYIHQPHLAPQEILEQAGIKLGENYPYPLVDHKNAREEALKRYKRINR